VLNSSFRQRQCLFPVDDNSLLIIILAELYREETSDSIPILFPRPKLRFYLIVYGWNSQNAVVGTLRGESRGLTLTFHEQTFHVTGIIVASSL
jgi:hypothetical protein